MGSAKVLIVDDSVVYRSQIRAALTAFSWIEIVGTASNGRLAIERLKQNNIDLLILDLEMPELDGLSTLTEISKLGISVKTLVFSSISKRGAEVTLEALRMGANDFVTKPGSNPEAIGDTPRTSPSETIHALLEPKLRALFPGHFVPSPNSSEKMGLDETSTSLYPQIIAELFTPKLLVIGSSTGGPTALEKIFTQIQQPLKIPVLITQHMPAVFTASLAERIARLSGYRVCEARHGQSIENGVIYIAPGDFHMSVDGTALCSTIKLDQGSLVNSVRPAVDPLFSSAAKIFTRSCLGLVLTGMGQDGKVGAQAIKRAGGSVWIQDRESSVVYGMPGSVLECGAYDQILTLSEIPERLRQKICVADSIAPILGAKNA